MTGTCEGDSRPKPVFERPGKRERAKEIIGRGVREWGLPAVHGGAGMGSGRSGDFGVVGEDRGFPGAHAGISGYSGARADLRCGDGLGSTRARARSNDLLSKSFGGG